MHRALVSRAFTPGRMRKLEDQIRAFCAACLDPLVGGDRFDFVLDLGARGELDDLPGAVGVELRGVDREVRARPCVVLADLQHLVEPHRIRARQSRS